MTILDKYKNSQGQLDIQMLGMLSKHQLLGYLYIYDPKSLCEEGLMLCQKKYLWNKALNLFYIQESTKIAQKALEKKIPIAFLKGLPLLHNVYPDCGTRYLSDIDIYTPQSFRNSFNQLMLEENYEPTKVKKWQASKHKDDFSKFSESGLDSHIDAHYQLLYNLNIEIKISNFLNLPTLPMELMLFHLITHLGFQHTYLRINWLLDVYHFYQTYKTRINWLLFQSYFECSKLNNDLKVMTFILKKYFDTELPIEIKLSRFDQWFMEKNLTENFLLNPQQNKLNYYSIKHYLNPNLYTAIRYDVLWVLSKIQGAK